MNKIKSIVEYAMRMENDAKEFYTYNLDRVNSPELKKLFEELVDIENGHFNMLSKVHEKMGIEPLPISITWVVDNAASEVNTGIIADNSELVSDEKAINDLSIVRLAYLMESDFALFYQNAADQVDDPEAKKVLIDLSNWEKGHQEMFRIRYEKLLKKSWSDITSIIFN